MADDKTFDNAATADRNKDIAPDAGGSGAAHLTANKEQLENPGDRPAEDAFTPSRVIEAERPAEVDPFEGMYDRNFDIPKDLQKVLTDDAQARPEAVILQDEHVATAPGMYRNVDNLDEVIEVQQGAKLPKGMRLIADHYIVREPIRSQRLGRRISVIVR